MKRIYFKDGEGKTVYVEVSDKVAETYMEVKREAWRNDSYEEYDQRNERYAFIWKLYQ